MSLVDFLLRVFGFNALALGNGPIMVPFFRKSLVEEHGVLTIEQLLFAFALAQVTPGQGNLYVGSLGYMLYGIPGAILATLVIVVPGYTMLPLIRFYERIRNVDGVRRFMRGLTSASVGVILAATVEIGRHALTQPASWVAFLLTLGLAHLLKWNALLSLLTASGAGLALKLCLQTLHRA